MSTPNTNRANNRELTIKAWVDRVWRKMEPYVGDAFVEGGRDSVAILLTDHVQLLVPEPLQRTVYDRLYDEHVKPLPEQP